MTIGLVLTFFLLLILLALAALWGLFAWSILRLLFGSLKGWWR